MVSKPLKSLRYSQILKHVRYFIKQQCIFYNGPKFICNFKMPLLSEHTLQIVEITRTLSKLAHSSLFGFPFSSLPFKADPN